MLGWALPARRFAATRGALLARPLCAGTPPPADSDAPPHSLAEPADTDAAAGPKPPSRRRELLNPAQKPRPGPSQWVLLAGGGGLSSAGLALAGFTHYDYLLPMLPDAAAAGLVALGGAMLAKAAQQRSGDRNPAAVPALPGEWKAQLVPLNDERRYAAAAEEIQNQPGGLGAKLGETAEAALAEAEKTAAASLKTARGECETAALDALKEDLAAGMPPSRVRQKASPRVFVIDFDTRPPPVGRGGTPRTPPSASKLLEDLRQSCSLLLHLASPYDEVVLRVTSPGGAVTDYGLAAAQFARLKAAGIRTTACVDLVAASGGYMLACAADRVLAAPFSVVGSIGVIAGVPNVHKLLEQTGVEFVQRTAGKYKRTLNVFTPNTEEGLQKFDQDLALIHQAFVSHVAEHRGPIVDPAEVCTGETWLGLHAQPIGLVDALCSSDQYLRARQAEADVYLIRPRPAERKEGLLQLLQRTASLTHQAMDRVAAVLGVGGREEAAGSLQADQAAMVRMAPGATLAADAGVRAIDAARS